jgi:hypothetical protein
MTEPLPPGYFGGVVNYVPGHDSCPAEVRDHLIRNAAALIGIEVHFLDNSTPEAGERIDRLVGITPPEEQEPPDVVPDAFLRLRASHHRPAVFLARLPGGGEDRGELAERLGMLHAAVEDLTEDWAI